MLDIFIYARSKQSGYSVKARKCCVSAVSSLINDAFRSDSATVCPSLYDNVQCSGPGALQNQRGVWTYVVH